MSRSGSVVVFEFSVMRCQPLRWALCINRKKAQEIDTLGLCE
ncbi:hypothetical protein VCHE16_3457 [Vibrio paracholerae HE-16]|nr:hypothetical protein VCHE16_3457 [Vibrio paracholerae HE-16]